MLVFSRSMIALLFSLALCPAPALGQQPEIKDIFVSGTEGYHTYRIPSLIVTKKGTLLAIAEGRKVRDTDQGDIDLVGKRSDDGGKTWGPLKLIYEEGDKAQITIGNPCPVVDQDTGTIWLVLTRRNHDAMVTHSTDDGKTWAPAKEIKSARQPNWTWYATGPGVGIQMQRGPHKGRLVIPCDHRADGQQLSFSHCIFSDDHGKTWQLGDKVTPRSNECQVAERKDGSLLINMRNHWARDGADKSKGGLRMVAVSKDGGKTWGDARFDKTLIEPICQASLLRYSWDGEGQKSRLLFSNPGHPVRRRILTFRLSYDEGETWPVSKAFTKWEDLFVGYSCLTVLPDGEVGCLYERLQKNDRIGLAYLRFSLAWLTDGKDK